MFLIRMQHLLSATSHDTKSQRHTSLLVSDSASVCVTGLNGDRYRLKLLQAQQQTHCFSGISICTVSSQHPTYMHTFICVMDESKSQCWLEIIVLTVLFSVLYVLLKVPFGVLLPVKICVGNCFKILPFLNPCLPCSLSPSMLLLLHCQASLSAISSNCCVTDE